MSNPFDTEKLIKEAYRSAAISKGDLPGHEFHGNQYTVGGDGKMDKDELISRAASLSMLDDIGNNRLGNPDWRGPNHYEMKAGAHAGLAAEHGARAAALQAAGKNADSELRAQIAHTAASKAANDVVNGAGKQRVADLLTAEAYKATKAAV